MSSSSPQTRVAILEAAQEIFESRGFGVGLRHVAERAGVSRQSVYLHFGSKGELLTELARFQHERTGIGELAERTVWAAPDARAALDAWIELLVAFAPDVLRFVTVLDEARRSEEDAATVWHQQSEDRRLGCKRLAAWLEREGALREGWTTRDAADLIWTVVSLRTYEELVVESGWTPRRFVRRLRSMLGQTLLVPS